MKKIIGSIAAVLLVAGLIAAYIASNKERSAEREREKPVVSESKVTQNAAGEAVLSISGDAQERIGLKMAALEAAQLDPEMKAYGHVLDPAGLSGMVAETLSARAAAQASQKEAERVRTLAGQDNASPRALQTAEAAAERDRVAAESARQRFLTSWGAEIAERKDLGELLQSLSRKECLLARVDLPAGELIRGKPTGARLVALSDESHPTAAEIAARAASVDAQTQGQGFLLLVRTNQEAFAPGSSVIGYLKLPGEQQSGVIVPGNAVTRFSGRAWVYVQTADQAFTRREIPAERPAGDGWFVNEGFKPGDRVAVQGARMLMSEEQKQQIRMGD